jgi:hypothetical protein
MNKEESDKRLDILSRFLEDLCERHNTRDHTPDSLLRLLTQMEVTIQEIKRLLVVV